MLMNARCIKHYSFSKSLQVYCFQRNTVRLQYTFNMYAVSQEHCKFKEKFNQISMLFIFYCHCYFITLNKISLMILAFSSCRFQFLQRYGC